MNIFIIQFGALHHTHITWCVLRVSYSRPVLHQILCSNSVLRFCAQMLCSGSVLRFQHSWLFLHTRPVDASHQNLVDPRPLLAGPLLARPLLAGPLLARPLLARPLLNRWTFFIYKTIWCLECQTSTSYGPSL